MKIKHIVLLKFQKSLSADTVNNLMSKLSDLKNQLDGIEAFSWGSYNSPEGLNQGFTHGFEMIFSNESARNEYLNNSKHLEIAHLINKKLESPENNNSNIVAFDFLTK